MRELESQFHPFKAGEVLSHGKNSRVYKLLDNPDFLAKHIEIKFNGRNNGLPEPKNFEEFRKNFEMDLDTIKKHLGEFLPEFYLTYLARTPNPDSDNIEKDAVEANAYMFMKKVTVDPEVSEANLMPKLEQLDSFIFKTVEMFKETFLEGKGLALDLKNEHFMFGTTKENPKSKLYFVDLYPRFKLTKNLLLTRITALTQPYMRYYNFPKVQEAIAGLRDLD